VKLIIFETTKNWLHIFEKHFIQIEAMDYIYHLYKLELVLIEVLQRRRKEKLRIAYVNRAGTG